MPEDPESKIGSEECVMEIREFIEARLKDDQAANDRAARFRYDHPSDSPWERSRLAIANGAALSSDPLIALHNPAREAREVAAKRAILAAHTRFEVRGDPYPGCNVCSWRDQFDEQLQDGYPCLTLRALASIFADHPDFDPAWRING